VSRWEEEGGREQGSVELELGCSKGGEVVGIWDRSR